MPFNILTKRIPGRVDEGFEKCLFSGTSFIFDIDDECTDCSRAV
jgi:hypothetical protein